MIDKNLKEIRNYGYDLIINNYETYLRYYTVCNIFQLNYQTDWQSHIPKGIKETLLNEKELNIEKVEMNKYFEEMTLLNLKEILIYSDNYLKLEPFAGSLKKTEFNDLIDKLNIFRRKIAHAKSTYTEIDLIDTIQCIKLLTQGNCEEAIELIEYINSKKFENAKNYPMDLLNECEILNNLPSEDYDLDGGFVGRSKEFKQIRKALESDLDRIITITGAGGVGKTAIALKIAYDFLLDLKNTYNGILWFSAKITKLTEQGIVAIPSEIKSDRQLIEDMMEFLNPEFSKELKDTKIELASVKSFLYKIFASEKYLIVIDNLETILENEAIVGFIKDIPRPTKILITSRKGLGEIERRFPLSDLLEDDAVRLFKLVAQQKNKIDLLQLSNKRILELVKRVKCYPLLIKWSIGQVCLGKDINNSFSQIHDGESEIARFSFNDVFVLLSDKSKLVLYSMIIYGDKPVSRNFLVHLTNLLDDELDETLKELILTSFIFQEVKDEDDQIVTNFSMLSLTRGFVKTKLDDDHKTRDMLSTKYNNLSEQIRELEKSKSQYFQSLISLGIKTVDEQIAFNNIKTAKIYIHNNDFDLAEDKLKNAIKMAPKLPYVLAEYSKYEFSRGHQQSAKKMAKEAVFYGAENYYAWFNYGILLKKMEEFPESIKCFEKAKTLNPTHLPIYNELGRVYTILGDYEKAHIELESALKEEKYPNNRHKLMVLQNIADNYKRWSEAFANRKDYEGQLIKLEKGYKVILSALELDPKDRRIFHYFRKISLDLGSCLCASGNSLEGRKHLKECINTKELQECTDITAQNALCKLIEDFLKETNIDVDEVEIYLKKAIAIIDPRSNYFKKFENLNREFVRKTSVKNEGIVEWYNVLKRYGVVKCNNTTYIFFYEGFLDSPALGLLQTLAGAKVSFILEKGNKGDMIAVDITIKTI